MPPRPSRKAARAALERLGEQEEPIVIGSSDGEERIEMASTDEEEIATRDDKDIPPPPALTPYEVRPHMRIPSRAKLRRESPSRVCRTTLTVAARGQHSSQQGCARAARPRGSCPKRRRWRPAKAASPTSRGRRRRRRRGRRGRRGWRCRGEWQPRQAGFGEDWCRGQQQEQSCGRAAWQRREPSRSTLLLLGGGRRAWTRRGARRGG